MLKVLTAENWKTEIEKYRSVFFNEEVAVIDLICRIYNYKPLYIAYYVKAKPIFTFIAFVKGRKILKPIHFFYSTFWYNEKFSATAYAQYLALFLKELQKEYDVIEFNIPVQIKDIRPFLWQNFDVQNRYTFIKNLSDLTYMKDVEQNIASEKQSFIFKKERLSDEILNINLEIFYNFKVYPKFKIERIKQIFSLMADTPHLTCYSAYLNGQLLASHILFIDEKYKKAYTIIRNKVGTVNNSNELHSKLYHHLFMQLKKDGLDYVDLMGADMPNIAAFKSRFKADLTPHFFVSYKRNNAIVTNGKNKIKNILRKIISKIS